jgi:hypothetical protein
MFHRATKTTHSYPHSQSHSQPHSHSYPVEIKIFPVRIPNTNKNTNKKIKSAPESIPPEQYSLTHTFFDPSRSSPPNYFMSHLQERLEKMDVNRNKE